MMMSVLYLITTRLRFFTFRHSAQLTLQIRGFFLPHYPRLSTMDETGHSRISMPLSAAEVTYSLVQQASANPDPTPAQELDPLLEPIWAQGSLANIDSLDLVFPSDEEVIKAMTSPDKPWDDLHHIS
jgi:hypothetical protein